MLDIRPYQEIDSGSVLEVHGAAIIKTAARDYDSDILEEWSPPIDYIRLEKFKRENSADVRIIANVGGTVVGFGELVTKESLLGACYVHPKYGRQGLGRKFWPSLKKSRWKKVWLICLRIHL